MWFCGLASHSYVTEVLRETHGIRIAAEARKSARLVSMLAKDAVGLLDQAYSGPPEVSFLPLYYAVLNLSKIYIVAAGRRTELDRNRHHGATYNPAAKASHNLLTEEITLRPDGVLPLFYEVLTGQRHPWAGNRRLALKCVYPYILGVSVEYGFAYKQPEALQPLTIQMEEAPDSRFRYVLQLENTPHPKAFDRKHLRILAGLSIDSSRQHTYVTPYVRAATPEEGHSLLSKTLRRCLIYTHDNAPFGVQIFRTPLSNQHILLPQELPIWLAFFHLSNVVRYKPEYLFELAESAAWPMLLALSRHGILKYLLLSWSYIHQTSFAFSGS